MVDARRQESWKILSGNMIINYSGGQVWRLTYVEALLLYFAFNLMRLWDPIMPRMPQLMS